jgi:hypothetical protein
LRPECQLGRSTRSSSLHKRIYTMPLLPHLLDSTRLYHCYRRQTRAVYTLSSNQLRSVRLAHLNPLYKPLAWKCQYPCSEVGNEDVRCPSRRNLAAELAVAPCAAPVRLRSRGYFPSMADSVALREGDRGPIR